MRLISGEASRLMPLVFLATLPGCFGDSGTGPESRWSRDLSVSGIPLLQERRLPPVYDTPAPYLRAAVTATNIGASELAGTGDVGCIWLLRIYDNQDYEGQPIWQVEDSGLFCRSIAEHVRLAGGATLTDTAQGGFVSDILGDREPGTYYLAAVLSLPTSGVTTSPFRLGAVDLRP